MEGLEFNAYLPEIRSCTASPFFENPKVSKILAVIAGTTSWISRISISDNCFLLLDNALVKLFFVEENF